MKPLYKVKLDPYPLIIRVSEGIEEVIFGNNNYISILKAENMVRELNEGVVIDWDNLK